MIKPVGSKKLNWSALRKCIDSTSRNVVIFWQFKERGWEGAFIGVALVVRAFIGNGALLRDMMLI